jgi:hypothetical protein
METTCNHSVDVGSFPRWVSCGLVTATRLVPPSRQQEAGSGEGACYQRQPVEVTEIVGPTWIQVRRVAA